MVVPIHGYFVGACRESLSGFQKVSSRDNSVDVLGGVVLVVFFWELVCLGCLGSVSVCPQLQLAGLALLCITLMSFLLIFMYMWCGLISPTIDGFCG